MENRVTDVLKNLRDKREISIEQCEDLSPSGSLPAIMYVLAKVHKIVTDGFHLLDLFCLPLYTSIQTCKAFSSIDRTPNN